LSALFDRAGEHYVYVVQAGEVHERRVDTADEDDRHAAIAAGLKAGEQVVADGSLSLADGTPVAATP
jgi:multidrug efflux pump subunit AcrA (membrane-fusion protein)